MSRVAPRRAGTNGPRAALAATFLLLACGTSATPQPAELAPAPPTALPNHANPEAATATPLCLPVVSGCGCAYTCGSSVGRNEDGTYAIAAVPAVVAFEAGAKSHDGLATAIIPASLEPYCFDERGRATRTSDGDARDRGVLCSNAFYDRTPCGGECIPTTSYLDCRAGAEGDCAPFAAGASPSSGAR